MSDYILLDGDKVKFNSACGLASLQGTTETTLSCSAKGSVKGQAFCVEGDEKNDSVSVSCDYTAGNFSTPGRGTLTIESLGSDQKATKTKSGGKPVLLKGGLFTAKFEVDKPAIDNTQTPPVVGPKAPYIGNGTFETNNTKWKGV